MKCEISAYQQIGVEKLEFYFGPTRTTLSYNVKTEKINRKTQNDNSLCTPTEHMA